MREDLADVLAAAGQASQAVPEYESILRLSPAYPAAHLGQGMALLSQNKLAEARSHLQAAAHGSDRDAAKVASQLLERMP